VLNEYSADQLSTDYFFTIIFKSAALHRVMLGVPLICETLD